MDRPNLFTPWQVGPYVVPNRVVMAPMTRCRAGAGGVPQPMNAEYYAQRASAGLLITEASQVSQQGSCHFSTPGIYTGEQVAGWRLITDAVHQRGGRIFAQLWHVGRASHPVFQPDRGLPVSASAVQLKGVIQTPRGAEPYPLPRALGLKEIPGVIDQYRQAARHALAAGFDGVELHGANGYLPDQFLRDSTNRRSDCYGGPVENRARFHLEVTAALMEVFGASRVGVRLSPCGTYNDMSDSNPRRTFGCLIEKLGQMNLAYLHLMEAMESDLRHGGDNIPTSVFRPLFSGNLIANSGFTRERAEEYLAAGHADAVAWGTLFLSNPDLPERFFHRAELNPPDPRTFYVGGEKGYIDYPRLAG